MMEPPHSHGRGVQLFVGRRGRQHLRSGIAGAWWQRVCGSRRRPAGWNAGRDIICELQIGRLSSRPDAVCRHSVLGTGERIVSLSLAAAKCHDYDNYGVPIMKATADWQAVTIMFRDLRQDGWGVVKPLTTDALTGFSIECLTTLEYASMPVSALYQGMITPLLPYEFRGALWYQGESNALSAHQYRKLLPELIRNWRDASKQKDLEFLIVQLPNHGAIPEEPGESAWAELREAEFMTLKKVPRTGMAVTIDVGDPNDLHPHRKREVGERLALWARGTIYKSRSSTRGRCTMR